LEICCCNILRIATECKVRLKAYAKNDIKYRIATSRMTGRIYELRMFLSMIKKILGSYGYNEKVVFKKKTNGKRND